MEFFSDFQAFSFFYDQISKTDTELKQYWDDCTSIYVDNKYLVFQAGLHSKNFTNHLEILNIRNWQENSKCVLDAGCGIGAVTNFFAEKHPDAEFIGLNISPEQLEIASKNCPLNVKYVEGSYDSLPFSNESFDFIYFYQSIGYKPLLKTLEEAFRVLKKGGRLLISDLCAVEDPDPMQAQLIQHVQKSWHYMCYPVWFHLKTAQLIGLDLLALNPNLNPILDFSSWNDLVNGGLAEYHNYEVPYAPIKVAEFLYQKNE
jgi:ubiquinone/menaquinone biosynthesis C-methylase UbiE